MNRKTDKEWKEIAIAYKKAYAKKIQEQKDCAILKGQLNQKKYRENK